MKIDLARLFQLASEKKQENQKFFAQLKKKPPKTSIIRFWNCTSKPLMKLIVWIVQTVAKLRDRYLLTPILNALRSTYA